MGKKSIIIIIVLPILFLVFCFSFFKKNIEKPDVILNDNFVEKKFDISYGSDSAACLITMYSSYQCYYCRKFFVDVFPKLKREYIDKGIIKLIIKPIDMTNDINVFHSLKMAICINRYGNFGKLHELLILEPNIIYSEQFIKLTDEFVEKDEIIAECMLGGAAEEYLNSSLDEFKANGLTGTPTFVFGNKVYKGFKPYSFFEKHIKNLIKNSNIY